jgi:hypothetical protein
MKRRGIPRTAATRGVALALLLSLATGSAACAQLGSSGSSKTSEGVQMSPQGAPQAGGQSVGGAAPDAVRAGLSVTAPSPTKEAPAVGSGAAKQQQMIIRNANMRLEVPKVTDTVDKIRALAKKYSGVISNVNVSNEQITPPVPQPLEGQTKSSTLSSGQPYNGTVTVLIPVARFDAFTDEVRSLGKLLTFSTDDQNVTQQHLDMKARLLNLEAEEARLRSFFNSAQSVNDMLAIEAQLSRVQGEIESLQAQITYLERQAAMATLTVELVEPATLVRPAGVDWGIGASVTRGVQGFADLLGFIITAVISCAPVWIIVLALALLGISLARRRRARKTASNESTGGELPEDDSTA